VLIAAQVATQLFPSRPFAPAELDAALAFLARLGDKRARLGAAAAAVLDLEALALRLRKAAVGAGAAGVSNAAAAGPSSASASAAAASTPAEELLDACKRDLAAFKLTVEALPDGTEPVVHATFHRVACEFHKLRGPAHSFFEHALLFLGNTPLEALALPVRQALALDVALAALVGEGVFNFGEVNAQPLLGDLAGTPHAWLAELLRAFQNGDVAAFERVVAANAAAVASHPALVAAEAAVREKITLAALVELAARRAATDRAIAFADVAREARVPVERVEALVLRALSLGLLKGRIDELERTVDVTFVRPRVLDRAQVAALKERVDAWRGKASTALNYLEEASTELLA
jgi:26S proteasome regulatory subunit N9